VSGRRLCGFEAFIGPVKFVVGALRRLDWTWTQVEDWAACRYLCICGGLLVVTGARSPLTPNKARGYCCLLSNNRRPLSPIAAERGVHPGSICACAT
jgi:hypothetical protein